MMYLNGQYYRLSPVPNLEGDITFDFDLDVMEARTFIGKQRILFGPKYHLWTGDGYIHPETGKIFVKSAGNFHVRAVFDGHHEDLHLFLTPS